METEMKTDFEMEQEKAVKTKKIILACGVVMGAVVGYKIGFNRATNRQIKAMTGELTEMFKNGEIACLDKAGNIMPNTCLVWRQFK